MGDRVRQDIAPFLAHVPAGAEPDARAAFAAFKTALEHGVVRAAERGEDRQWRVNTWVKQAILLGFRLGQLTAAGEAGPMRFFDKDTWLLRNTRLDEGIRIPPGGAAVRAGVYLARGVIMMPPSYCNVGAYVDEGT